MGFRSLECCVLPLRRVRGQADHTPRSIHRSGCDDFAASFYDSVPKFHDLCVEPISLRRAGRCNRPHEGWPRGEEVMASKAPLLPRSILGLWLAVKQSGFPPTSHPEEPARVARIPVVQITNGLAPMQRPRRGLLRCQYLPARALSVTVV